MCRCTPEIRIPYCEDCFISNGLPIVENIPKMPPVVEPPLCNLRAFYDAACATITHNEFLYLVKKAQQTAGV